MGPKGILDPYPFRLGEAVAAQLRRRRSTQYSRRRRVGEDEDDKWGHHIGEREWRGGHWRMGPRCQPDGAGE